MYNRTLKLKEQKMEMEIQDANGKKVVKIPAANQKGINIVTWGFAEKAPKFNIKL